METFEGEYERQRDKLGRFNLAIFGKTGVGKSTLINSIFSADVAATGNGRPVTKGLQVYDHPSGLLRVYDSEGIEVGEEGDEILEWFRHLFEDTREAPLEEHIHVIWYCLRWSDRRLEDAQAEFVQALADEGLPVVMVFTQVPMRGGEVHPDAVELAKDIRKRKLPLSPTNRVFFTMAAEDDFSGHPVHGLQDLLDATFRVAPKGVEAALVAAQKIDLDRKAEEARKFIRGATVAAAGVGGAPIPFADAPILVGLQMGLMAKIAAVFGLGIDKAALATLAGTVLLGGGATQAGKYIVTSLLKAVPGGNVVAGGIRATVASSMTYAVGEAWIVVCKELYRRGPEEAARISAAELRRLFMTEFKKQAKKKRS